MTPELLLAHQLAVGAMTRTKLGVMVVVAASGCATYVEGHDAGGVVDTRTDSQNAGKEGGPCYGNGTCDDGLVCLSDLCVNFADARPDAVGDAGSLDAIPDSVNCETPMHLYPDADGDSYGSSSSAAVIGCSSVPGLVPNNEDCADGDPNAYPGQAAFFTEPIEGQTANEWDYNCDGVAEPKELYKDAIICANRGYTICETAFAPSWWGTGPAKCGETRKIVVSCTLNGGALNFTCDPNFEGEATQPCR